MSAAQRGDAVNPGDLARFVMDALDLPADVPETRSTQGKITAAIERWFAPPAEEVLTRELGQMLRTRIGGAYSSRTVEDFADALAKRVMELDSKGEIALTGSAPTQDAIPVTWIQGWAARNQNIEDKATLIISGLLYDHDQHLRAARER